MSKEFVIAVCALLVILVSGLILKLFPPSKINNLYGYRTKCSMKNINNWEIGNAYAASLMIYLSIFCLILTGILSLIKIEPLTLSYIVFAFAITIAIIVVALMERKLRSC